MNIHIQTGRVMNWTADQVVTSGQIVKIGSRIGACETAGASGDAVSVLMKEVVQGAKASGDSMPAGTPVYWNDSTKVFTTTSGGNTLAGYAFEPAIAGDLLVNVDLNG
jgi:predicted RecA/RadA family phage recombinase